MAKVDKKRIDALAGTRDFFGKNTREGIRAQNQINDLFGVGKRKDWSNMPTASQMKIAEKGKKVASLHFEQLWPLVPSKFIALLEGAKEVVAVEGNATGQFAGLIRRETGFEIKRRILRYDGLPITPEYILRETER